MNDATQDFEQALERFLNDAQALVDNHMATNYPALGRNILSLDRGKRYIRVVNTASNGEGQRSVHCFVDTTNGNVLKSASWKAPELKNPRGNVYSYESISEFMTPYGTKYLR